MKYRLSLRGFDMVRVEHILKYSTERYVDVITGRFVVVGKHGKYLVAIPYERQENVLTPVTIHVTSRQQINFRVKTGRFRNE